MNPNDTPETDELAYNLYKGGIRITEITMLNHARKLELERNANQAMIDKLKIQLTAALDTVAKLEREKQ